MHQIDVTQMDTDEKTNKQTNKTKYHVLWKYRKVLVDSYGQAVSKTVSWMFALFVYFT